jgi:hypothetical protein
MARSQLSIASALIAIPSRGKSPGALSLTLAARSLIPKNGHGGSRWTIGVAVGKADITA